jgi:hypothetical protein
MSKGTRQAVRSRIQGILILECLDTTDPGSEGRFLSHMLNIMEAPSQYIEIRTREQLIAILKTNPFNAVHITTHGHVAGQSDKFQGFWTPKGTVRLEDLPEGSLQKKIVISTACRSGTKKFAQLLVKRLSPTDYIAPTGSPKFHNSIYFAHWFYHNVLILKLSPAEAVKKYNEGYKNPHDFVHYER